MITSDRVHSDNLSSQASTITASSLHLPERSTNNITDISNDYLSPTILSAQSIVTSPGTQSFQNDAKSFDELLASTVLPPPGPAYYAARRQLWLQSQPPSRSPKPELTPARQKLERILNQHNVVQNDSAWDGYLEKVWRNISTGGSFKNRLPLNLLIKIIHASWLRDDTWPAGLVAPEPDDVLLNGTAL